MIILESRKNQNKTKIQFKSQIYVIVLYKTIPSYFSWAEKSKFLKATENISHNETFEIEIKQLLVLFLGCSWRLMRFTIYVRKSVKF